MKNQPRQPSQPDWVAVWELAIFLAVYGPIAYLSWDCFR